MSEHTPSALTTGRPPREATAGVLQVVDLEAAEHDWEIYPGMVVHGYTFNGQTPGPVIEARVGDTLLVQFTNLLPEPTTLRWHGLPEPTAMNGSELAADPIPPGGRLHYRLHLPHAGTFWYDSPIAAATQSNRGPSGVLVVRDPEEPAFNGERVLLFHDLEPEWCGQLTETDQMSIHERGPQEGALLVNGVLGPEMQIAAGQVERWRLVNATSARHLRLFLGGHRFRLIRTGSPTPDVVDEMLMAAGDRLDIAVGPFPHGETVVLEVLPHDQRVSESFQRALATLHVAPPDSPSRAPGVNLGVMAQPRTHGVAGGAAELDFSGRGMDTLKMPGPRS